MQKNSFKSVTVTQVKPGPVAEQEC